MKKNWLLALLFLACTQQPRDPVLARVGHKVITREEFLERADFSPEFSFKGPDSARAAYLLDLLIDEKLAALAAESVRLDSSIGLRQLTGFIEDMAIARELYMREVRDKVQLSRTEIDRATQLQAQTRTAGYLVFGQVSLARRWQERLSAGLSFNDALRGLYGHAADTTLNRREIKWGFNSSAIEEAVFSLRPGETSAVVPVEGAYVVMMLMDVKTDPIVPEAEAARRDHFARHILTARKEAVSSDEFIASFAKEKKLLFNKPLLRMVVDLVAEQSLSQYAAGTDPVMSQHPIDAEVWHSSVSAMQSHMEEALVSFNDGQLTIRQILEKWRGYNFPVDRTSVESCKRSITRGMSLIVRDVLLAREGRKRGYAQLTRVRDDAKIWQDYYLCAALQQQLAEKERGKSFSWRPLLTEWRATYGVHIDSTQLRRIGLASIPVLALRIGQYNAMVVPPWPSF